jgi:hypothetical protein
MNNKLEKIWKEAVIVQFIVLSQHLPGGTEEKHKKNSVRIASLFANI